MREELKPLRLAVAASFAGGEVPDEALLARIDEELTAQSYIVPGLGDAGDLAYGIKTSD